MTAERIVGQATPLDYMHLVKSDYDNTQYVRWDDTYDQNSLVLLYACFECQDLYKEKRKVMTKNLRFAYKDVDKYTDFYTLEASFTFTNA